MDNLGIVFALLGAALASLMESVPPSASVLPVRPRPVSLQRIRKNSVRF